MMRLRKMTGVCMQQDLHFSSMTVTEHLVFYGELRVKLSCLPSNANTL